MGAFALVMSVLMVLTTLFTFIQQQEDIGEGQYTTGRAFLFSLMTLPQQAWELLPIAALIGALLGLGTLARGSELIVMRGSGISIARIAGAVLFAGMVLTGIEIALGEFIAPPMQEAARQQKAFDRFTNVSFGGGGGAWVRDGDLILNVHQQSSARQFGGMRIFELSSEHRLRALGQASRATAGDDGQWVMRGYQESRFTPDRILTRSAGERMLASNVSAQFLGLAVTDPRQMQTLELWQLIQYYNANNLDARPYVFALWSRVARTVGTLFAVLLAVPFVLGSLRSSGTGARTLVGLVIGVGLFLLQRLIESGTLVFGLNPVLLAWLPTLLLAATTVILLVRAR